MTERDIFIATLQIADKAERAAYLAQACGSDQVLLNRVEQLLRTNEDAESFLASPAPGLADTISIPMVTAGQIIGPYKLLQQIGEGGMGVVYMAEQTEPVHRKVALKIIKPGMDSRQVIARFEAERQALAMMDHVNIARVIDGGTISSPLSPGGRGVGGEGVGRPYFVMELINGIPITKYCDDNHLTPRERLELFVPVCQAIQHAHQKGIIHRDIKPSNVLVTIYDGKPVPKVIDFGVAKAIDQKLTDNTLFTNFGTMVGTLEYMSPEQAEMNNLGVDTRSDIYSLGVLLYELLTGSTPLTRKQLKEAANLEILRLIKEEEPQKPSTRLSKSGDALASISALRKTEPAKLSKLMRGELDWIVMKTLEKDRNRRYETANGLAVEVQRYLADETVLACPPSRWYRVRKFVRRNKVPVIAASLVLIALVAGVIGTSWGLIEANQARSAEQQRAEGEKQAKLEAITLKEKAVTALRKEEEERKYAQAIAHFVRDDFLALTSIEGQDRFAEGGGLGPNRNLTLRELLDRAAEKLDRRKDLSPRTEADLRWMIGVNYRALAETGRAITHLERSMVLRREVLGPDDPDTLSAENSLALAFQKAGRLSEAIKLHEKVRDGQVAKLGIDDPDTLATLDNLAGAYKSVGRLQEAIKLLEQVRNIIEIKHGANASQTLAFLNNIAVMYSEAGRVPEAIKLLEKVRDAELARVGPNHPRTLTTLVNLAGAYLRIGRLQESFKLYENVRDTRVATLGPEHPDTLASMHELAGAYQYVGKMTEAEKIIRESLEKSRRVLGEEHRFTLSAISALAVFLQNQSRLSEAGPYLREPLEKQRRVLGEDHPHTLMTMLNLGTLLRALDKPKEAELLVREALEKCRRLNGAEHPQTLVAIEHLGSLLMMQSKFVEAEPYLRETLEKRRRLLGENHLHTLTSIRILGNLLRDQGKFEEAMPFHQEALDKFRRLMGADHRETLMCITNMGRLLHYQGKLSEAEPYLREASEKFRRLEGAEHQLSLTSNSNLGLLLHAQDKLSEAEPYLREGLEIRRRRMGAEHRQTILASHNLGALLRDQGKLDEAEPLLRDAMSVGRRVQGENHPLTLNFTTSFGLLLQAQKKYTEVTELLKPIETVTRNVHVGSNAWRVGRLLMTLGNARAGLGNFAAAESDLVEAHLIFVKTRGLTHKDTRDCMKPFVDLYTAWHAAQPGKGYDVKAEEYKSKLTALSPAVTSSDKSEVKSKN